MDDRTAVERMVAALGGWERATRRLTRIPTGDVPFAAYCVLCHATSRRLGPDDRDSPDLIVHDRECFIAIARSVLGISAS